MALFNKETQEKKTKPVKAASTRGAKKVRTDKGAGMTKSPARLLKAPLITEKATYAVERSVYVFEVAADATKNDVATAIEAVYKVAPRKVNIVRRQPRVKISRARRRSGVESGMKKAYVYLKKGDKIDVL